jgi:hypothetical protein
MPPILLMLPEACWLGVKPNDNASSLGLLNACPLSIAAKNAEALTTPIPGILSNILPLSLSSTNYANCFSIPLRRFTVVSYSLNISITIFCIRWLCWGLSMMLVKPFTSALLPQGNTTPNSLSHPLDWLLSVILILLSRSRTRCRQLISCCNSVLIGTKRICGPWLASVIANGSLGKFLLPITKGGIC